MTLSHFRLSLAAMPVFVLVFLALGNLGCEKDNADSTSDDSNSANSASSTHPSSVGGTWAGGGISVSLTQTRHEGEESEGKAVLNGTRSGTYAYESLTGFLYAAGDWQLSGNVNGNTWSASYYDGVNSETQVTLKRQ